MTQKQKYSLGAMAVLVCVAVVLFIYFQKGGDAYLNVLPKDATALVRLNLADVIKKAEISDEDLLKFNLLSSSGSSETPDPSTAYTAPGIDFRKPLYGFVSGDGLLGAVASVADANDLAAFCETLMQRGHAGEVTRQRGLSWVVIGQQWLLTFDNTKALVMGPAVGTEQDNLRTLMSSLMSQKRSESLQGMPLFASVGKQDEPLVANLTSYVMPQNLQQELKSLLGVRSLDDVQLCVSLDLEPDELELEAQVLTENEAVKERLKTVNNLLRPMRGDLLRNALPDAFAWVGCNVEGTTLLDMLRKNAQLRTLLVALNMAVDADLMLKSVDGDITLEVTDPTYFLGLRRDLPVRLLAQLHDTDFMSQAGYWIESANGQTAYQLTATSPHDFLLEGRGQRYWFGVNDHVLYVAGSSSLAHGKGPTSIDNERLSSKRKDIKGARLYAELNVQTLTSLLSLFGNDGLIGIISRFQQVSLKMEDAGELELKLTAPEGTHMVKDLLHAL